mmetsp:Transcript_45292/g.81916  ORF Transcript_45292/g.81916 Transcript_45292/m.81916 type:complete len:208 (-) Transcript_45292:79-702(-)
MLESTLLVVAVGANSEALQRHCDFIGPQHRQSPGRVVAEELPGLGLVHLQAILLQLLLQGGGTLSSFGMRPGAGEALHGEDHPTGPLHDLNLRVSWLGRHAVLPSWQNELHPCAGATFEGDDWGRHRDLLHGRVLRRTEDAYELGQAAEALVVLGRVAASRLHRRAGRIASHLVSFSTSQHLKLRSLLAHGSKHRAHGSLADPSRST